MDRSAPAARDEFTPTTAAELSRFVADNGAGPRRSLIPAGGRTSLHYGSPTPADGLCVSTSELVQVIDYPARDMTITAQAGLRIEELQRLLAEEGQRLPIDIPQAYRATLGGAVATNTSGPGRFAHGTLRDYVIGISAVDGRGRLFSAGGRVVKNVAGYDLCKLLVGSLGTLAVITQVTLKLRPIADSRRLGWIAMESLDAVDAALGRLTTSATRPVAIEVLNPKAAWQIHGESDQDLPVDQPVLLIAYEGSEAEASWQADTLREDLCVDPVTLIGEDAEAIWSALTEYQAASDDPVTFQAGILPSQAMDFVARASELGIAVQCHAGNGIVIGHLPDSCSTSAEAAALITPLREKAEQAGGALVILNCDADWKQELSVFGTPGREHILMSRIKSALDPHGVLNPGRFPALGDDAT